MSDLGGIKLDLGLVDVYMTTVLLHGVSSAVRDDLTTSSSRALRGLPHAREGDASNGGSWAVDVGSGRYNA